MVDPQRPRIVMNDSSGFDYPESNLIAGHDDEPFVPSPMTFYEFAQSSGKGAETPTIKVLFDEKRDGQLK